MTQTQMDDSTSRGQWTVGPRRGPRSGEDGGMELSTWALFSPCAAHAHVCTHARTHAHTHAPACTRVCTPVQTPGAPSHSRESRLPHRKPRFAVICVCSLRGRSSDPRRRARLRLRSRSGTPPASAQPDRGQELPRAGPRTGLGATAPSARPLRTAARTPRPLRTRPPCREPRPPLQLPLSLSPQSPVPCCPTQAPSLWAAGFYPK